MIIGLTTIIVANNRYPVLDNSFDNVLCLRNFTNILFYLISEFEEKNIEQKIHKYWNFPWDLMTDHSVAAISTKTK